MCCVWHRASLSSGPPGLHGVHACSACCTRCQCCRGVHVTRCPPVRPSLPRQTVWLQVYRTFMEAIDAIDNGKGGAGQQAGAPELAAARWHAPPSTGAVGWPGGTQCPLPLLKPPPPTHAGVNQWDSSAPPKYVNNTHLSARVGRLNPDWNEDASGVVQAPWRRRCGAAPCELYARSLMCHIWGHAGTSVGSECSPSKSHWGSGGANLPQPRPCPPARRGHHAAVQGGHGAGGQRVHGSRDLRRQGKQPLWTAGLFKCLSIAVHEQLAGTRWLVAAPAHADSLSPAPPAHVPERRALPPPAALQSWLPARSHVKEALEQRLQVHPSGACATLGQGARR